MTIDTKQLISEQALREAMLPENRQRFDDKEVRLSAIGTCPRKQVLGALEGTAPIDWSFDVGGHLLQGSLGSYIYRMLPKETMVGIEKEVKHPWGTAHIDIIVDEDHIVEVKSIKCSGLGYSLPKEPHIWQVKGQMLFLEEEIGHEPVAEIIYGCRDHFFEHFKAFPIPFPTLEERLEIRRRLKAVHDAIQSQTPPEVPFEKPTFECGYKKYDQGELKEIRCQFYDLCWSNGKLPKQEEPVVEITDTDKARPIREYKEVVQNLSNLKQRKEFLENEMVTKYGDFSVVKSGNLSVKRTIRHRKSVNFERYVETKYGIPTQDELAPYTKETQFESFSLKVAKE